MYRILAIMILSVACSGKTAKHDNEGPTTSTPAPNTTAPADTKVPVPSGVSKPRLPCSAEIDVECPEGYEIGCIGDRTTSIVCVKKGAVANATCEQQIMLSCPPGEINSCFANPRYGNKHICVRP